jgi:hypothetical protein
MSKVRRFFRTAPLFIIAVKCMPTFSACAEASKQRQHLDDLFT